MINTFSEGETIPLTVWREVSNAEQSSHHRQTWLTTLTVTRTQWRSMGSPPDFPPPRISDKRLMLLTRRMLMSFSQQKAWIKVKWICRATSSSSSVASRHNTTLSGSLKTEKEKRKSVKETVLLYGWIASVCTGALTYAFRDFAASYTPTVMQPWGNAELRTSSNALATESILERDKNSAIG